MLPLAAKLLCCYLSSSTPVATSMIQFCVYLIHWKLSACDDASGTSLEKKALKTHTLLLSRLFLWLFSLAFLGVVGRAFPALTIILL